MKSTRAQAMDLTPDQFADWQERSAIMQYDGGLSQAEAEAQALERVKERAK